MKFGCVLEHLENLRHVKDAILVSRAWIHYFGVPKLRKWFHAKWLILLHLTQNDVWLCFGEFRNSWTCKKMENLCSVCRSCENDFAPNASIVLHWTPNDVWLSFGAFRKPSVCKKMQNLCFRPKCTIWCTEVVEMVSHEMHPFYPIRHKMKFGCVLEHLENLRHVMRCKTFVSGLNALFLCTEVVEIVSHQIHPFYSSGRCLVVFWSFRRPLGSKKMQNFCFGNVCTILVYRSRGNGFALNASIFSIGPQMMFACVLEHLENLRHVKRCKTCVSGLNALF
jgi:hypothetical protein